jgi:hypothetical protein
VTGYSALHIRHLTPETRHSSSMYRMPLDPEMLPS